MHLLAFDNTTYHQQNNYTNYDDYDNERFKRQYPPYYNQEQQEAAAAAKAAAKEEAAANREEAEAESIANDLKDNSDLADGNYYSAKDIEAIIKRKYP